MTTSWWMLSIPLTLDILHHYQEEFRIGTHSQVLHAIAESLTRVNQWPSNSRLLLIDSDAPSLTLIGQGIPTNLAVLQMQAHSFEKAARRIRYISYEEAASAAMALAEQLREELGPKTLTEAHFVGVPRGGLIVVGMLAYALALRHEQLSLPSSSSKLLVVVDDCSLTGYRFRQFAAGFGYRPLVFAPLYSHPALREALQTSDPRLQVVVSAHDLATATADSSDSTLEVEGWNRLLNEPRLWFGRTEHLCFAWGEPKRLLWQAGMAAIQQGWPLAPASHSLANQMAPPQLPMQTLERKADGLITLTPHSVAWEWEGRLLLGDTQSGVVSQLDEVAQSMYLSLLHEATTDRAVASLAALYNASSAHIRNDLTDFAQRLVSAGYVTLRSAS